MALKKTERSVQSIPLPEFTGGLTNSQSQDNECQVFDNVDISRNQWTASRAGTTLAHNPGAIDYTPVMGIANYGLGDGALHIVVVKTSGIGYYHKPQQGWQAGDRVSFSTFTLPYSPGTNEPVYFEAMAFKGLGDSSPDPPPPDPPNPPTNTTPLWSSFGNDPGISFTTQQNLPSGDSGLSIDPSWTSILNSYGA